MQEWFRGAFAAPTAAQTRGWPPILDGRSTLLLAPTGSGKTLAAFLAAIDRLMFTSEPSSRERCRVLYVSPLKALAVDVERNLRAPIAGIAAIAERRGEAYRVPSVAIRSGDTPASERARISRTPPDVLITTPESLYLLLTSQAREALGSVETVIVDEIHAIAGSKRGAHLFLSLERLETLRPEGRGLQRIGLSATQRPLEEIARLLGGGEAGGGTRGRKPVWKPRPVEIVDAGSRKALELFVEVPVEDMARLGGAEARPETRDEIRSGPAAASPGPTGASGGAGSIWPSIYPRLVELVRAHRSTMIFTNSRRLAERLAGSLNETAGEEIALAHHGSVAREKRLEIEDRLKRGDLPAIVATSSLELGIDMGAVDLVVQIEAPPSIASGMQRIGRAGHAVGEPSRGILFPKYRGDLLAAAAATARMQEGKVEETTYPRNPLDVLAQQIVAIAASAPTRVDDLYRLVRGAAPFADLPRSSFEGVLDMLSGRYPSDEFAELRPRITWDRVGGEVRAREGARHVAVVNAGTIPDRGLYGVFLATGDADARKSTRVGELDEEMVFESQPGDVFVLGASSWRIEEITHDRVMVSPAPGLPGKMPFWHGDRPGRPTEFGQAIGALARELAAAKPDAAAKRLREEHGLDARAATNLIAYLEEQREATGEVPSDRTIVVERYQDDIGDWRVCVLSPWGARVHAPWATAALAALRESHAGDVEALWSDDGMVFRVPESDVPPDVSLFLPPAEEVEDLVVRSLGESSLFAARFRENAARALLLPRRHPGRRSPLWQQRKRAADLLAVAARYGSFPIILETYREALRDVFDLPGLKDILTRIASRSIRVVTRDTRTPSPFAASLLFSYVANFIYDADAPLAERRAQALSVDQAQLRELLGEAELRELFDPGAIESLERSLQRLEGRRVRHADGLHDLLLSLGDLSEEEIRQRSETPEEAPRWLEALVRERRVIPVRIAGEARFAAAEDAGRLRDALGIVPPPGLPAAFLESAQSGEPVTDLVSRYARTHGPFRLEDAAARWAPAGRRGAPRPRPTGRAGTRRRGRLPAGRPFPRVVRRRNAPRHQAAFAREAAARGRARRAGGVRPLSRGVAERRGAARRPRSASLRRRAAPGLPDSGVRPRDRSPSGAGRALPARGPGLPAGVGRNRLARPRAARPVGRARRALPDRSRLSPRAARAAVDGRFRGTARRRGARDFSQSAAPSSSRIWSPRRVRSRGTSSPSCGTWSGRGRSRTTRSRPCARCSRAPRRRADAVPGAGPSAPAGWARPEARAVGFSCRRRARLRRTPSAGRRSRGRSSNVTAC